MLELAWIIGLPVAIFIVLALVNQLLWLSTLCAQSKGGIQ